MGFFNMGLRSEGSCCMIAVSCFCVTGRSLCSFRLRWCRLLRILFLQINEVLSTAYATLPTRARGWCLICELFCPPMFYAYLKLFAQHECHFFEMIEVELSMRVGAVDFISEELWLPQNILRTVHCYVPWWILENSYFGSLEGIVNINHPFCQNLGWFKKRRRTGKSIRERALLFAQVGTFVFGLPRHFWRFLRFAEVFTSSQRAPKSLM